MDEDNASEATALAGAYAVRRAVLGDSYVDGQRQNLTPVQAEFQDYLTGMAWGVWNRGGPLTRHDRSLLVLVMTAALGRMEEFKLHATASVNAGVTDEELDELPFQVAAYCGAPAGLGARRAINEIRAARGIPQ
jgi:4-carboxymuconolactone decarboxylase